MITSSELAGRQDFRSLDIVTIDGETARAFDDAVVLGGNVPMDVLAKNVDDYIARTKRSA